MKVQIPPGMVVRLTPKINSSGRRGGTYDLDALEVPEDEQKAISELKGVTIVSGSAKSSSSSKKKGGDS